MIIEVRDVPEEQYFDVEPDPSQTRTTLSPSVNGGKM